MLAAIVVLAAVAVEFVGTGGFVLVSSDLSVTRTPASSSIGSAGYWLIVVVVGAAFVATWRLVGESWWYFASDSRLVIVEGCFVEVESLVDSFPPECLLSERSLGLVHEELGTAAY